MSDPESQLPAWPVLPAPTPWQLPDAASLAPELDGEDLVAFGADLEPGTILAAYVQGLFPMDADDELGWWSPDPRGVLPLDGLVVSRSLRASCRRFRVTVDIAFSEVIAGCAGSGRGGQWITPEFVAAYTHLHDLGWVHSLEVWDDDGDLVGGLYGVAIGGLFAGESMFHRRRDASKVALVALVGLLSDGGRERLLDVQWVTPHLSSLGAVAFPRPQYRKALAQALRLPLPKQFATPSSGVVIDP